MKKLRLISLENKFYEMVQIDESIFKAIWGRTGENEFITIMHGMDKWDDIIEVKRKLGYKPDIIADRFEQSLDCEIANYNSSTNEEHEGSDSESLIGLNIADRIAELQRIYILEANKTHS